MVKGNKPDTSEYSQTANNTKAYNHGNDIQYGASGGDSEEQDTGRQEMAGAYTFQAGRRADKQKVIPSRKDFNGPVHQHDVSSATQTSKVFSGTDGVDDVDTDTPDDAQLYSNFEPVNGPRTQDTEDQLIGAVYTEDFLIAQETLSPQEQERSDELVCEKKDTPCVTDILPSSKNYEENVHLQSMCPKERQHKKRLTRTEECGVCENGVHATVRHDFPSHQAKGVKVFKQCKQKIGLILCPTCKTFGTCFRIGERNIATCYHVFSKCTGADHPINAVFYHQGPNQQDTRTYSMTKQNDDAKLDYVIYELCNDYESFPPPFTKFRDSTHADGSSECLVYLAYIQKYATDQFKLHVNYDTVRLNSNAFDECHFKNLNLMVKRMYPKNAPEKEEHYWNADSHRNYGHVPLICKVVLGGSGGVGVSLDRYGDVVVDFMYKAGFPAFYYETNTGTALTTDEKENFPGCLLMEVGLDIRMISL